MNECKNSKSIIKEITIVYDALESIPVSGIESCAKMAGSLNVIKNLIREMELGNVTITYPDENNQSLNNESNS